MHSHTQCVNASLFKSPQVKCKEQLISSEKSTKSLWYIWMLMRVSRMKELTPPFPLPALKGHEWPNPQQSPLKWTNFPLETVARQWDSASFQGAIKSFIQSLTNRCKNTLSMPVGMRRSRGEGKRNSHSQDTFTVKTSPRNRFLPPPPPPPVYTHTAYQSLHSN